MRPSPVTLPALLDSGSDITVIPRLVAKNLNLRPAYVGYALDIGGVPEGSTVFSALVSVEKEEPAIIEVLTWGEEYVLLGRDMINQWRVLLDGPEQTLTISRQRIGQ